MPRARYLRADAWLSDLRALHAQGLSDRAIARELGKRYPQLTFTRRRVFHWRKHLIEDAPGGRLEDFLSLTEANHAGRRVHQIYAGYGDLLPDYVDADPPFEGFWTHGIELTKRQADILALVRDHGPLTRPEIARKLGRHPSCYLKFPPHKCPVRRLVRLGLLLPLCETYPQEYTLAVRAAELLPCG
jgi:hypothetical protein